MHMNYHDLEGLTFIIIHFINTTVTKRITLFNYIYLACIWLLNIVYSWL